MFKTAPYLGCVHTATVKQQQQRIIIIGKIKIKMRTWWNLAIDESSSDEFIPASWKENGLPWETYSSSGTGTTVFWDSTDDESTTSGPRNCVLHRILRRRDRYGHDDTLDAFTMLLELGCTPTAVDDQGRTILHILAKEFAFGIPFIDTLMRYIDVSEMDEFINAIDNEGKSAIFYATLDWSADKVCKLLELSANPFCGVPSESYILHGILRRIHHSHEDDSLRAIKILLEWGCDPTIPDKDGRTALHFLVREGSGCDFDRLIDTLMTFMNNESEKCAFVDAIDNMGRSALQYAIMNWSPHKVYRLLEYKANPFGGVLSGTSILHGLVRHLHHTQEENTLRAVNKLFEMGFDPNIEDDKGQTALHLLLAREDRRCVDVTRMMRMLLKAGIDVNMVNREGSTALHIAVASSPCCSTKEIVDMLLENGADGNSRDGRGQTALHILIRRSNMRNKSEIISCMLRHGVDPTLVDRDGNSPLNCLGYPHIFDPTVTFLLLQQIIGSGHTIGGPG